jgi:hypothetical protein
MPIEQAVRGGTMEIKTPMKAIRAKCMDCSNNQIVEVRECPIINCPLYPYRMGHNPNRKGIGGKGLLSRGKTESTTEGEEIIEKNISSDE